MIGPGELVHGERELFIGGCRWQPCGLGFGSPVMSAGGGGCSRVFSRPDDDAGLGQGPELLMLRRSWQMRELNGST